MTLWVKTYNYTTWAIVKAILYWSIAKGGSWIYSQT